MLAKRKRPPGWRKTGTDTEAYFLDVDYTTSRTETQGRILSLLRSGAENAAAVESGVSV